MANLLVPAAGVPDMFAWPEGAYAVVEARGELDVYTAGSLRSALTELDAAGRNLLAVDMAEVTFMDSSGLGVLIGGVKRARACGGALVLAATPDSIRRTLRITGVLRVMPVFDTVPTALCHLGSLELGVN
ncbi:MAG TPA: STAS domain-containing protein [Actinocrinis sp.]